MDHVEHAGTPASETSATLSTDEDVFAYVFTAKYGPEGVQIDRFVDATLLVGQSSIGMRAAEKLLGVKDSPRHQILTAIHMMMLRSRMDGAACGPYLVRSPLELGPVSLELVIRKMTYERQREFFDEARL